jgi:hypothetical protein
MERILSRLERRFGRLAIPNLIGLIVGGMAIVFVLTLLKPEFQSRLTLDLVAVRRGEVWRLVTFLFIPPATSANSSPVWLLINLYFTWWVGSSLEQHWGPFKFNAYYLLGALGTIVAAVIAGPATNFWLDSSLFLAFATIFPNVQILLFFILPIRVKWLGIIAALGIAYAAYSGGWGARGSIAASLVNYLLFFTGHWVAAFNNRGSMARQRSRLESLRGGAPGGGVTVGAAKAAKRDGATNGRPPARPGPNRFDDQGRDQGDNMPVFGTRVCAICGAEEADGTDIRVCSCDKCGGKQRALCLEHARNH